MNVEPGLGQGIQEKTGQGTDLGVMFGGETTAAAAEQTQSDVKLPSPKLCFSATFWVNFSRVMPALVKSSRMGREVNRSK